MAAQRIVLALAALAAFALAFLVPRVLEPSDAADVRPVQLTRPSPDHAEERSKQERGPREKPRRRPVPTVTPAPKATPPPPVAPQPPPADGEPENDGEGEGEAD